MSFALLDQMQLLDAYSGDEAVSDVSVSDGVQSARAISFFSLSGGRIVRLVEYWPEPFAAPAHSARTWSSGWIEPSRRVQRAKEYGPPRSSALR
jgi:hypothetical protein